jgi:hypothetical protein
MYIIGLFLIGMILFTIDDVPILNSLFIIGLIGLGLRALIRGY